MADENEFMHSRLRAALAIAVAADAIQIVLFPLFIGGVLSPFNDLLDLLVAGAMCWLLGFHVVFLPTFVIEEVPIADIAPTWTAACFVATTKTRTELRRSVR